MGCGGRYSVGLAKLDASDELGVYQSRVPHDRPADAVTSTDADDMPGRDFMCPAKSGPVLGAIDHLNASVMGVTRVVSPSDR